MQPPRYAISAEAREVYRRRGRAQRGQGEVGEGRKGGREGGRGLVRQGSRVDAWARVRPQERDRGHAEEQGLQGGSWGQRGSDGREKRRGEEHRGERGARGLDGLDSPARRY